MQLRRTTTEQDDGKNFDVYVYTDDGGATVYQEAIHFFSDILNSDEFMVAEVKLNPDETLLIRDHSIKGRPQWRLICRTQHELNGAPDIILIGQREE